LLDIKRCKLIGNWIEGESIPAHLKWKCIFISIAGMRTNYVAGCKLTVAQIYGEALDLVLAPKYDYALGCPQWGIKKLAASV
jgi:hypothetical protein